MASIANSVTPRFLVKLSPSTAQEAYPEAAIVGGVVMGRRVVAKRGQGALSNGRGVGALAISGNAPLFAMTCLDRNGGISWGSEM